MSRIRSRGTKIELKMKKALEESDLQFQYQPRIFGKPDFLVAPNIIVFCDSSFWHGRNWPRLKKRLPSEYWRNHIEQNRKRDKIVNSTLKGENYIVLRFWDNQIDKEIQKCIQRIKESRTPT